MKDCLLTFQVVLKIKSVQYSKIRTSLFILKGILFKISKIGIYYSEVITFLQIINKLEQIFTKNLGQLLYLVYIPIHEKHNILSLITKNKTQLILENI